MSTDCEIIGITTEESNGGLTDLFLKIGSNIKFKVAGLMFLVIMFLNTNVIIDRIFSTFDGAVSAGNLTSRGTTLMAMFTVIAYILLDVLDSGGYI